MLLNAKVIAVFTQLQQEILNLKSEMGAGKIVSPSIDIFHTSIFPAAKEKLKAQLVNLGVNDASYFNAVDEYKQIQMQYLNQCVDAMVKVLQTMISNKNKSKELLGKLIKFIEDGQLAELIEGLGKEVLNKINSAIKLRFMYFLTDGIYSSLCQVKHEIDLILIDVDEEHGERQRLYPLFMSELNIREASILATGSIPRFDELIDIFILYKNAGYGASQRHDSNTAVSYYHLAIKSFSQLSKASSMMRGNTSDQQLSVLITPVNHETTVGRDGLVRSAGYGVTIRYTDSSVVPIHTRLQSDASHSYRIEPWYDWDPKLKIAYLKHIEKLTAEIANNPQHAHYQRRLEKLAALQHIFNAAEQKKLSPDVFKEAKSDKPSLFCAFRESETQKLILHAEDDLRVKMWQKAVQETQIIGEYGYFIKDATLVSRLSKKRLHFTDIPLYDTTKKIKDLIQPDLNRSDKSGHNLWRYDKKMALEIMLIAHHQQLLHPALLHLIEELYPMMYARSFSLFRKSEVESLFKELKQDILSSLWNDSSNEDCYHSSKRLGGDYV